MNIELTTEEARALMMICDLACKAQGLQVAKVCIAIAEKINAAIQPPANASPSA